VKDKCELSRTCAPDPIMHFKRMQCRSFSLSLSFFLFVALMQCEPWIAEEKMFSDLHEEGVDAFSERQILKKNRRRCSLVRRGRSAARSRTVRDLARGGGTLWSGADGPRPGAGRSATWCRSFGPLPDGRTVRALRPDGPRVRRGGGSRRRRLDLAPGRDPVGEERS
jgi:hypothetical protein